MTSAPDPAPFVLDDTQRALRATVRDFLAREPVPPPGEPVPDVPDPDAAERTAWRRLGTELGVLGLDVPETWGGGGAGLADVVLVAEELGAALSPLPYTATTLAAWTLLASGEESALAEHLPALCAGASRHALVHTDPRGRWTAGPSDLPGTAPSVRADAGGRLSGTAAHVVGAGEADQLLVLADALSGPSLFVADADAPGVVRSPVTALDPSRPQADVAFDRVPARPVGAPGTGAAAVAAAADRALVVLAAEALGTAERAMAVTVEYAGTRIQFGRAIGSFQAVKHRCADVLVAVEQARSLVEHAAWTADRGGDDPALVASLARLAAAGALTAAAAATVQVHGGIGFTWEHLAHRVFKRAHSDAVLWGGLAPHRERVAALVLDVLAPA